MYIAPRNRVKPSTLAGFPNADWETVKADEEIGLTTFEIRASMFSLWAAGSSVPSAVNG